MFIKQYVINDLFQTGLYILVENIKEFNYLGHVINFKQKNTGYAELTSRIDMAETAFYKYGRKLMNYKIMLRTRVIILNALVRSRLIYGCQVWTLSRRQIDMLNCIYYKMLRKMVCRGFNRRNADAEEWSFNPNQGGSRNILFRGGNSNLQTMYKSHWTPRNFFKKGNFHI